MNIWILALVLVATSVCAEDGNKREAKIGKWICKDRSHGDLIAHPEDCRSYFVCDRDWPKQVVCEGNLHYDAKQRVCNWPQEANCVLGEYPPYWDETPRPTLPTVHPDVTATPEVSSVQTNIQSSSEASPPTTPAETTDELSSTRAKTTPTTTSTTFECNTSPPTYRTTTPSPSNSSIGSTDQDGRQVDPMKTYDPKKVQCLYNGVYFLPHPGNCQKYFICANHVLYLHGCGIHAHWNFKAERCDYKEFAQCYINAETTVKATSKKRRTPRIPYKTTVDPKEVSTSQPVDLLPKCNGNEQRFIPHATDCSKYYICIHGKPALTKCPVGLWWDHEQQYCGFPTKDGCKSQAKTV